jgi:hypothetical protein
VRHYVAEFGLGPSSSVLDPFCGTGTTCVECKMLGVPSTGVEGHPMSCFASSVKVDWSPDPDALLHDARAVAARAQDILAAQGIEDNPVLPRSAPDPTALRGLPPEQQRLLLKGSISPLPLHKTLVLLEAIDSVGYRPFRRHEKLALAKALVDSIANLHFGPEVGVTSPKADAPVVGAWIACVERTAKDLRLVRRLPGAPAEVRLGDARQIDQVLGQAGVDAVITSPPYPNEKDYTRTTRLETVLLGFAKSLSELRALKQTLVRSNTRGVYKDDADDALVADLPRVQQLAAEIERRRIEMGKTSGFERMYARVTKLYFGGMARHFTSLRAVLRPGARLAYVVGDQASYLRVMIRTGEILADIAQGLGYEVIGRELFRTRLATATGEQLREEVLLLRWPG